MKFAQSTKQFTIKYNTQYTLTPIAWRFTKGFELHPLQPKIQHLFDNRDRNILWWRVNYKGSLTAQANHSTGSWCARRVRKAFADALKERGFDRNGSRIKGHKEKTGIDATPNISKLRGSIEITILPACIKEKYAAVQQDMGSMVDKLLQEVDRSKRRQKKESKASTD